MVGAATALVMHLSPNSSPVLCVDDWRNAQCDKCGLSLIRPPALAKQ